MIKTLYDILETQLMGKYIRVRVYEEEDMAVNVVGECPKTYTGGTKYWNEDIKYNEWCGHVEKLMGSDGSTVDIVFGRDEQHKFPDGYSGDVFGCHMFTDIEIVEESVYDISVDNLVVIPSDSPIWIEKYGLYCCFNSPVIVKITHTTTNSTCLFGSVHKLKNEGYPHQSLVDLGLSVSIDINKTIPTLYIMPDPTLSNLYYIESMYGKKTKRLRQ